MTNDTTNKPTKEEAIKVIRYLMANDVELMLGPSMASNGYTEIDEESIGRFMDSPKENFVRILLWSVVALSNG